MLHLMIKNSIITRLVNFSEVHNPLLTMNAFNKQLSCLKPNIYSNQISVHSCHCQHQHEWSTAHCYHCQHGREPSTTQSTWWYTILCKLIHCNYAFVTNFAKYWDYFNPLPHRTTDFEHILLTIWKSL